MLKSLLLSLATVMVIQAGAASADETYHINLSPPAHPGERFQYTAIEREWSDSNGRISTPDGSDGFDFTATAQVQACDAKGHPSQVMFSSPSLTSAAQVELLPSDVQIIARNTPVQDQPGKFADVFTLKDEPLHPFVAAALRRVVTIGSEKEPTEQEAFGTNQALPVGGSWSLGGQAGSRLLEKMQLKADPAHVSGRATLVERLKFRNEIDCLKIQMTVDCDRCPVPVAADQAAKNGSASAQVTYYISVETGRVVEARYRLHTEVEIPISSKDSPPKFLMTTTKSRVLRIRDVPP